MGLCGVGTRAAAIASLCCGAGLLAGALHGLAASGWSAAEDSPAELTVQELMRCSNGRAVLVLREKEGERRLLVPISPDEARSLDQRLRGQRAEAGNAKVQELATGSIRALGGQIVRASIDAVSRERVFYGRLTLGRGPDTFDVEARPADAVALALEQGAPLFAARAVLDSAGITLEEAAALRDSRGPPAAAAHAGASQVLDI
jgi:bifunctional DNase/RNase